MRILFLIAAVLLATSIADADISLKAYVCKNKGAANSSFYDCGASNITFSAQPAADDLVCASSNKPGPWNPTLGRPGNFVAFASIADTMSICVCNSATCKAGDNIESYALKSSFASGTSPPTDPVPDPPGTPTTPPSGTGELVLNWTLPIANKDGSPFTLSELIGFSIYCGMNPAQMPKCADVTPNNVTTYTLTNLAAGTWYVSMTARTATEESDRTSVGSKVVTGSAPTPVDCVVSAWSAWTSTEQWSACDKGSQQRNEQRVRTIVTPASNGGAACGALSESRVAIQACTVTPPPTTQKELCLVDGISGGTRPGYEFVNGKRNKLTDAAVGPASQPVGTLNPFPSVECSCTDFVVFAGNPYARYIGVLVQGKAVYGGGCQSHGLR